MSTTKDLAPPVTKQKSTRPRQRNRLKTSVANSALQEATGFQQTAGHNTVKQIHTMLTDATNPNHQALVKLVDHLSKLSNRNLTYAIGLKFRDNAAFQLHTEHFAKLDRTTQRQVLAEVLADDWAPVVKTLASSLLPVIWNKLRQTPYAQRALKLLKDYTGVDLNDDKPGYLGNPFTFDPSLRRGVRWDEMSEEYAFETRNYDGVSSQAIASVLFPEFTASRVPADVSVKSGLVSRSQTYTLTTNASGNAIFCLFPLRIAYPTFGGQWILILNDSTLNVDSGSQTPAGTGIAGPLSGLTSVVTLRTTATTITVEPIVSSLNNQGRLITTMSNGDQSTYTTSTPTGISGARDREYVTYSSIAGCSGHRLAFYDSSVADESFAPYSALPDADFMQLIVQGASASTAVLQVTVSYQVEYTINSNVLVELSMPPTGPATSKCLATSLAQNPQLRLLGRQESLELYSMLLNVKPRYADVMSLLVNHQLRHAFDSTHIGEFQGRPAPGGDQLSSMDMYSPILSAS